MQRPTGVHSAFNTFQSYSGLIVRDDLNLGGVY
jgi:hypothetical protein